MPHARRPRCVAILVACLCAAGAASCGGSKSGDPAGTSSFARHTATRDALGARFRVTVYAPPTTSASVGISAAFERLDEIDRRLNPDRPDSEISKLNATAGGSGMRLSDDLFGVLQQGQRLSGISRGAFDLTVGPYTDLWRRGAATGRAPSQAELEDARLRVGWEKLRLDTIERTATLTVADMRLDPAGIAAGYAADQMIQQLRAHGCERARVEFGNVVLLGAAPPGTDGWTVGLRRVGGPRDARSMVLADVAIAFSTGPQAAGGRDAPPAPRLVNPTNGRPVSPVPRLVVVARRAAHAESVAAAAAVLGPDAGELPTRNVRGARVRFAGKPSGGASGRR